MEKTSPFIPVPSTQQIAPGIMYLEGEDAHVYVHQHLTHLVGFALPQVLEWLHLYFTDKNVAMMMHTTARNESLVCSRGARSELIGLALLRTLPRKTLHTLHISPRFSGYNTLYTHVLAWISKTCEKQENKHPNALYYECTSDISDEDEPMPHPRLYDYTSGHTSDSHSALWGTQVTHTRTVGKKIACEQENGFEHKWESRS